MLRTLRQSTARAKPTMSVHRSISVQFQPGEDETRVETLLGREYLVFPVVAMVEGVRFGAAQDAPELGLATEFGATPISWANRPLVMNHPKVDDVFVSANQVEVLEEWSFGLTMNPVVEEGKLKLEAWIDVARATELGGEFQEVLDRVEAGETIEVSVGFFSDLEPRKGKFNGQVYSAVWRNIKPDHLAILSAGTIGACSIKDGCGMPRLNAQPNDQQPHVQASTEPKAQCSCGCGGEPDQGVSVNETDDKIEVVIHKGAKPKVKTSVPSVNTTSTEETPEEEVAAHRATVQTLVDQYLTTQNVDGTMMSNDVNKVLNRALRKKYGSDVYLYGYTQEFAVFEVYDFELGFIMKQVGVNVSADNVEFVGEPKDVILLTRIVPQESNMPNDTKTTPKVQEGAAPVTEATTTTTTAAEVKEAVPTVVNTTIVQASEPKPLTVQEYIASAPEEMRDVLSASLKLHQDKKESAIKTLKDAKAKFSDDFLKAQSLETLEGMVALLPGTYSGVATPSNPTVQGGSESQTVPVTKVFAKKTVTESSAAAA